MKLFAGSASQKLAQEIAALLTIQVSRSVLTSFGNSEIKVRIEDPVEGATCIVVQSTVNPTNDRLMELAFFCDALKRSGAKKIIGVVPFFGYAKQNIQHLPGECVSVHVVIQLLESLGFSHLFAFDIHDEGTAGIFSIPFKNISALPLLAKHIKSYTDKLRLDMSTIAVVSPDQGGVERIRTFGKAFFGNDNFNEVFIEKKRDQYVPDTVHPLGLYGDVKGKTAIIVDDMIVSGGTMVPAIELCMKHGARDVIIAAVHSDFTKDAPHLLREAHFKKYFTTNTIELTPEQTFSQLEQISVAQLIVQELKSL